MQASNRFEYTFRISYWAQSGSSLKVNTVKSGIVSYSVRIKLYVNADRIEIVLKTLMRMLDRHLSRTCLRRLVIVNKCFNVCS